LDPPFLDFEFIKILQLIKEKKIFRKNHLVIIHRERKSKDEFKNLLKIIEIKEYGRSKIIFGELI
jgi:16S rRNA (guanine966-N2)-methyltransferase